MSNQTSLFGAITTGTAAGNGFPGVLAFFAFELVLFQHQYLADASAVVHAGAVEWFGVEEAAITGAGIAGFPVIKTAFFSLPRPDHSVNANRFAFHSITMMGILFDIDRELAAVVTMWAGHFAAGGLRVRLGGLRRKVMRCQQGRE